MRRPPSDVIAAAQAVDHKWRVPAAITIAQWALESGWGEHTPAGSNNPFGIKARPGKPFVEAMTREVLNGVSVHLPQRFRAYRDLAEAFDDHGRLLAQGGAYARARGYEHHTPDDDDRFGQALQGTYATDTHYGALLHAVMAGSALYAFDIAAAVPPVAGVQHLAEALPASVVSTWAAGVDRARAGAGA